MTITNKPTNKKSAHFLLPIKTSTPSRSSRYDTLHIQANQLRPIKSPPLLPQRFSSPRSGNRCGGRKICFRHYQNMCILFVSLVMMMFLKWKEIDHNQIEWLIGIFWNKKKIKGLYSKKVNEKYLINNDFFIVELFY